MKKMVGNFVIALETAVCPICEGFLTVRDWRSRKVIETDGFCETLIIRRLYCDKCRKLHSELPDIIVPYKRHCAETILNIISGNYREVPCSERTISRIKAWWKALQPYFLCVLQTLTEKHGTAFGDPPAFKEIIRAVVNSNNYIITRSVINEPREQRRCALKKLRYFATFSAPFSRIFCAKIPSAGITRLLKSYRSKNLIKSGGLWYEKQRNSRRNCGRTVPNYRPGD